MSLKFYPSIRKKINIARNDVIIASSEIIPSGAVNIVFEVERHGIGPNITLQEMKEIISYWEQKLAEDKNAV